MPKDRVCPFYHVPGHGSFIAQKCYIRRDVKWHLPCCHWCPKSSHVSATFRNTKTACGLTSGLDWTDRLAPVQWLSYGLDSPGFEVFFKTSRPVLGLPQSPFIGYRVSSPGLKRPERGSDHCVPSCAEVKNKWIYTSVCPVCLQAWTGTTWPLFTCGSLQGCPQ